MREEKTFDRALRYAELDAHLTDLTWKELKEPYRYEPSKARLPAPTGNATVEGDMKLWFDDETLLKHMADMKADRELWRDQYIQFPKPTPPPPGSLAELLTRFTYRPGWMFSALEAHGMTHLSINAEVVDADNPKGPPIRITFNTAVDHVLLQIAGDRWKQWLREQIRTVEMHEVDEFFQIDGHKPFDPH